METYVSTDFVDILAISISFYPENEPREISFDKKPADEGEETDDDVNNWNLIWIRELPCSRCEKKKKTFHVELKYES